MELNVLDAIYTVLVADGRASELSERSHRYRKSLGDVLRKKEGLDRKQGLSRGWIAFAEKDYRHMFNRLHEIYGDIPIDKLQSLFMLMLGKYVGRRTGELIWIAAESWDIEFHDCGNGVFKRGLRFTYCYQKGVGPGKFHLSLVKNDPQCGDVPIVALGLVLFEKKKMIRSAIGAYQTVGGSLAIDGDVWETADELSKALQEAENTLVRKNMERFSRDVDDDDDMEDVAHNLMEEMTKQQHDQKSKKTPFWTQMENGLESSVCFDLQSGVLEAFGEICYYTSSPDLRFGGTCARKGFQQDARSSNGTILTVDQHVYNRYVPANILASGINPDIAMAVTKNANRVRAAFENATFFDKNKEQLTGSVLPPVEFLQKFARSHEGGFAMLPPFVCCGTACSDVFMLEGDWRKHMANCKNDKWVCLWCDNEYEKKGSLSKHLAACHMKRAHLVKPKQKDVEKPFNCDLCGNSFTSKDGVRRHKKEYCKKVERADTTAQCECGAKFNDEITLRSHKEQFCEIKTTAAVSKKRDASSEETSDDSTGKRPAKKGKSAAALSQLSDKSARMVVM